MKKVFYIILLIPVMLGACGKTPSGQEDNPGGEVVVDGPAVITVATCNVLKPSGRQSKMLLSSPTVLKALAKSIVDTGADIIGFNELDENFIAGGAYSLPSACSALKGYKWSIEWPNDIHESGPVTYSYANGFAYNAAKLTLEESGYVWLSKEEMSWYVKPESAYLNAGSPERTCIWARMTHKATGKVFWLFVTHLPTSSQGGAANMAWVVGQFASQKAGAEAPQILTGDMNSSPGSTPYWMLWRYWQDGNYDATWGTLSGSGSKSSGYHYPVETYTKGRSDRRIDHIMTRGCTASDYHTVVVTYNVDGEAWCPSDHLPVVATVTIE